MPGRHLTAEGPGDWAAASKGALFAVFGLTGIMLLVALLARIYLCWHQHRQAQANARKASNARDASAAPAFEGSRALAATGQRQQSPILTPQRASGALAAPQPQRTPQASADGSSSLAARADDSNHELCSSTASCSDSSAQMPAVTGVGGNDTASPARHTLAAGGLEQA